MAYVDTGLGWYADGEWLSDEVTDIGELVSGGGGALPVPINGKDFTGQPVAYLGSSPTGAEIAAGGYSPFPDTYNAAYNSDDILYIAGYQSGNTYAIVLMTQNNTRAWSYQVGYSVFSPRVNSPYVYDGITYYCAAFYSVSIDTDVSVPIYSSETDCLTALALMVGGGASVTHTFKKSTLGYSITCMCKWITTYGGDVYFSPVLISSAENSTLYTRDNSIPSVTASQHVFQDITFYMRKAPLDTLDGSETITSNFPVVDLSGVAQTNDTIFTAIAAQSLLGVGPVPEDDPYAPGGTSGAGGGEDATFDFTSTDIPVPSLPSTGASNTGFLTLYKPDAGKLQSLAAYMWSGAFDLDNFRKLVANPMDAILGLHIIPTISGHPATSSATLKVGNISTGLSMDQITEQYYELDCGTINIEPKWGAYLDYAPYSKLTLYLPYVGFVPISPDDCMNGSIKVVYHVDILSGACCVYVYCTSNRGADSHVLYTYTGACACDCPVTEGQYTNAVLGILGVAGGVAGAISSWAQGSAAGVTGGVEKAANAALSMFKPDIGRSGSFGGSAGLMGIQYPYLVLTVPRMCTPEDQQKQEGYPSFVTKSMGQLVGYNQVQVKRLEGMTCTANETEEILTLLEGGVIF